jgi:hypothetical protein
MKGVGWAGHVARTGTKSVQGFGGGRLKERDNMEDLRVDGRIYIVVPYL